MIAYCIGAIPLVREIWDAHPRVTQPWYTDDAGAGGSFGYIMAHFQDLQGRLRPWGYVPELTKSILVVALNNIARAEAFFRWMVLKVATGSCYLFGFIGDQIA